MEVFNQFQKGKDGLKGCLESTVRYDSISVSNNSVKNIIHLSRRPLNFEALSFSLSSL